MKRKAFAIFHMNLAFSAVDPEARVTVIDRCYEPLLSLLETGQVHLGIEASAWTLTRIGELRPQWLVRFRNALEQGLCSFIGSGWIQLIGPLVPAEVNRWNQELGMAAYEDLLGLRPRLALVNEMAFAPGLVNCYLEAGYDALVMERENLALACDGLARKGPWLAAGVGKASIPLLLADAILFQKFQRDLHGDILREDYLTYLDAWDAIDQAVPIYCSDAEIFGYRPKRYHYEVEALGDEWQKMRDLFGVLADRFQFISPTEAVCRGRGEARIFHGTRFPVPVKKQPKYNVARWAVTGRDDLYLNSLCHGIYRKLAGGKDLEAQRDLCSLWSSDLRTHTSSTRHVRFLYRIEDMAARLKLRLPFQNPPSSLIRKAVEVPIEGHYLNLESEHLALRLNTRRGLAIDKLGPLGETPWIGTLAHGYFESIPLGADFYTGGLVIEQPDILKRTTDLERVEAKVYDAVDHWEVVCKFSFPFGGMVKRWQLFKSEARVRLSYEFENWERPFGSVRVGHITLIPEAWGDMSLECHNGGAFRDRFPIREACAHQAAPSSLISCTTGFGATEGEIVLTDGTKTLRLSWDPSQCAAFPMLYHQPSKPSALTRLIFSLAEWDDTRKDEGFLTSFYLDLELS